MSSRNDPVTAKTLNKEIIRTELENRKIQVIELGQLWRHIHGKVMINGQVCFLKLASTDGISRATRNEVKWNRHIIKHLKRNNAFSIPKIINAGLIGNLYYYISDFIDGDPLCISKKGASTRRLLNNIDNFVLSFYEISRIKPRSFVWDYKYKNLRNSGKKFYRRAVSFFRAVDEREDLIPLLEIAQNVQQTYQPGLAHGDLTPWHMLKQKKGGLILTDAEWASSNLPKYYDLSYCYHRLCTCSGGFKIAAKIARDYRSLLKDKEKKYFDDAFHPLIAERVIGGYWDALKGANTAEGEMQYHKKIRKLAIKKRVFI